MGEFSLSGGVEVTGFISPTDTTDTYPVLDTLYGIDGLRNVDNLTQLNAIPNERRRAGMLVGVSGGTQYYKLNPSPWTGTTDDWTIFTTGGGSFTGNTSGDCITDLYITNLYGCSPITVNNNIQSITSSATGATSFAFGYKTIASGDRSHAEGDYAQSIGMASHAEGRRTYAIGPYSHSEGVGTSATTNGSHAEGSFTTASGTHSHAEGYYTTASGEYSHAEGYNTTSSGWVSHTEGYGTVASNYGSHAEGGETTASGNYSHSEGRNTTASGHYSHTEGKSTLASGTHSHAEGEDTISSGTHSHAEGARTTASGDKGSHAEGIDTIASGQTSHAEGNITVAGGTNSHAEGFRTTSSGVGSHSQGRYTIAGGDYSHAGGSGLGLPLEGVAINSRVIANGFGSFAHFTKTNDDGDNGAEANYSAILGGTEHRLLGGATNSAILGGSGNTINNNVTNTIILGGKDITATISDTVYIPNLNVRDNITGDTLTLSSISSGVSVNNLGIDINGNVVSDGYIEVNITSAQILTLGSTPVSILSAPGANKYYEYYGEAEYTHVSTAYTFANDLLGVLGENTYSGGLMHPGLINSAQNKVSQFTSSGPVDGTTIVAEYYGSFAKELNEGVVLTTLNGTEPTLGDGTILVKIWYKVRTFGSEL